MWRCSWFGQIAHTDRDLYLRRNFQRGEFMGKSELFASYLAGGCKMMERCTASADAPYGTSIGAQRILQRRQEMSAKPLRMTWNAHGESSTS
jgi:hypothetical protein